ncbi:MAG TPA: hypothetical protein VEK33_21425 [Terriglobales bacterium]|nr:hypothetical protein [Terriglobales bacterium]
MVALRLVRLIETKSERITRDLVRKIQTSPRTSDLQKVPDLELLAAIRDLLQNLQDWLLAKTESDVETRYREMGARLARQGVALAHACWAVVMIKENLWSFLEKQAFLRSPIELYGEMELLWVLNKFFDCALCSIVGAYAESQDSHVPDAPSPQPRYTEVNLANLVP